MHKCAGWHFFISSIAHSLAIKFFSSQLNFQRIYTFYFSNCKKINRIEYAQGYAQPMYSLCTASSNRTFLAFLMCKSHTLRSIFSPLFQNLTHEILTMANDSHTWDSPTDSISHQLHTNPTHEILASPSFLTLPPQISHMTFPLSSDDFAHCTKISQIPTWRRAIGELCLVMVMVQFSTVPDYLELDPDISRLYEILEKMGVFSHPDSARPNPGAFGSLWTRDQNAASRLPSAVARYALATG